MIFSVVIVYYFSCEAKKMYNKALESVMLENELKIKNSQLLLSQIKPHFIYNTLATIQAMITKKPELAQNMIFNFSKYLRTNINSIDDTGIIVFEEELKHVKTYVEIEKCRFSDRINIIYDIQVDDFVLPPLTLQPLVENAIKHGICEKIDGGTIQIKTWENSEFTFIDIIDDGVGFEFTDSLLENSIGLKNVKYRLKNLCNATMDIFSKKNIGTRIHISIPKELGCDEDENSNT